MKYRDITPMNLAEEYIRLKIKNSANNQSLPSQRDIAEKLNISRSTVKAALARVQDEGKITVQSRRGIQVHKKKDFNLLSMASLSDELSGENMVIKHIGSKRIPMHDELMQFFGPDLDEIIEIRRVRLLNNEPFSYEITNLDEGRFQGISQLDFTNRSLYHVLEEQYNTVPEYGNEHISSVLATGELCDILQTAEGTPLYVVESFNFTKEDRPVEHTVQYLPGKNFMYHFMAKSIFEYQKEVNDDII